MPRPSQLDLDVRFLPHPAPDVLGLRLCSYEYNRGKIREPLEGCFYSNYYGCHRHDGDVPSLRSSFLSHSDHMNGFAVLGL